MKHRWLPLLILSFMVSRPVWANTSFVTEPLSMGDVRSVDFEFRPSYRSDKFTSGNTDFTHTLTRIELIGRWVPIEKVEGQLVIPHVAASLDGGTTDSSDSGIGQVILGGKYAFTEQWGGLVRIEAPTGDQDDLLG